MEENLKINLLKNIEKTKNFEEANYPPFQVIDGTTNILDDKGIIEVIATTEKPVTRYYIDWEKLELVEYGEVLVCNEEMIDTERLDNKSLVLFKDHHSYTVKESIGVLESYTIDEEKKQLRFTLKLDLKEEQGKICFRKIKEGFLKSFSVGYRINWDKSEIKEDDDGQLIAECAWIPLEISLVGIPADAEAQVVGTKNFKESKKRLEKKLNLIKNNSIDIKTQKTIEGINMSKKKEDEKIELKKK